jgi:cytochrome subunit of sulfide dehydrogenase
MRTCGRLKGTKVRALGLAAVLIGAAVPALAELAAPPGAAACSGCHGARTATIIPSLQGQAPDAIVAAMQAFRTGVRPATVMDRIAKGFTDEEIRAIAAWASQQR